MNYHSMDMPDMNPSSDNNGVRLLGMHYHGIDLTGMEHRIVSLGQTDYLVVHPTGLPLPDVIELAPGSVRLSGSTIELRVNGRGHVGGKAVSSAIMSAVLAQH